MRVKFFTLCLPVVLLILSSCSTPKNITYFQDAYDGRIIDPAQELAIRLKPEDKLSIVVNSQDPTLSQLFNLTVMDNRITTNNASQIGVSGNNNSGRTAYYTVNKDGDINFPLLGHLHVAGMSRSELTAFVEKKLIDSHLIKDPIVTVEFVNTGISIMGEVASPGRYEFNKDHLTIIDALASAGDLTNNGMRENVLVMRETADGQQEIFRVDLTDLSSLAQSPVYYMQQNDVIYVEPNDKKKRETTPNGNSPFTPAFWFSVCSFGVTIASLVITLTQ